MKPVKPDLSDGRRKIQDVNEFIRWYNAGYSYREMVEFYRDKYNLEVRPTMFSNLRVRLGLKPRLATRRKDLVPWSIQESHRPHVPMRMLQLEQRRLAGLNLTPRDLVRLNSWKDLLDEGDLVVHYEPDTELGFFYVPRRHGTDLGLIREPV